MKTLSIIRDLCAKSGTSIKALEKALGFGNGSIAKANSIKAEKLQQIADYFGVSLEYLMTGEDKDNYLINPEIVKIAQAIMENNELALLFDAAKDASPEDLITVRQMLLALKRKERSED